MDKFCICSRSCRSHNFNLKNYTKLKLTIQIFIFAIFLPFFAQKCEAVPLNTIVYNGNFNTNYTLTVNSSVEYVFQYSTNHSLSNYSQFDGDIRVFTKVDEIHSSTEYPVMFVVRQTKDVLSWVIPFRSSFGELEIFSEEARTLCQNSDQEFDKTIYITVATSSKINTEFNLRVAIESRFIIKMDKKYSTEVSLHSPRFFKFIFPPSNSKYILLKVTSRNKTCMTVSVQNSSCPVLDRESNVRFLGYWQTMLTKAGMTIRKSDFPNGFYVVFVVHSDDSLCKKDDHNFDSAGSDLIPNLWMYGINKRSKNLNFFIEEKITEMEYIAAIFGTVGIFLTFYVFSIILSCIYGCKQKEAFEFPEEETIQSLEEQIDGQNGIENAAENQGVEEVNENPSILHGDVISRATGALNISPEISKMRRSNASAGVSANGGPGGGPSASRGGVGTGGNLENSFMSSDSSLDETDYDILQDLGRYKDIFRMKPGLTVADLSRKSHFVLAKKSQQYLWTLLTVFVFYSLPVVQLVFTYQKVLHTTGNQDLCYYNYLCSHPLWKLSDFNHVYSNIGYVMLGSLFILLVFRKNRIYEEMSKAHPTFQIYFGIPKHFGLFYAMGFALVMEGVLSGSYHVCPNHSNFQFDTCFMYVNALLCMLKIYQTRHPDINAGAYMAFSSLAFFVLIGVIGVLVNNLFYWILFTIFHVLFAIYLSSQIYYLGRWKLDSGVFRRTFNTWRNDCLAGCLKCLRPIFIDRMIFLILANLANWAIAGFGIWKKYDFETHLLFIFMANLMLYTTFYIIMKLSHRERILFQPLIYIILSIVFWSLALYVFLQRSTSWQSSPAKSRSYNRECILLRFYDTHDVWHFLSAASMFFSFMVLLTLDDDLITTHRSKIPVF